MIYFMRSPAGSIKIGTTIRLSQRLRQLAAEHGPGLEVLAVADGSFEVERALHGQFTHLRRVGEWFEPGDDLLRFIASNARPWDGVNEAGGVRSIRVDEEFARAVAKIAALSRQSAAEWIDQHLLPLVLSDLGTLVEQELIRRGLSA